MFFDVIIKIRENPCDLWSRKISVSNPLHFPRSRGTEMCEIIVLLEFLDVKIENYLSFRKRFSKKVRKYGKV